MNWFDSLLTVYTKSCRLGLMSPKGNKRPEWDRQRIQALRRHLGLTQRQMADELGTRQQTISEWETGMYQPRGASATLLSFVAERAKFKYDASPRPTTRMNK
jgi:DNA-binding XRE family transcriptional regulator